LTAFAGRTIQPIKAPSLIKNWSGVTIKWDSRGEQAILHNDMARVERVPKKLV